MSEQDEPTKSDQLYEFFKQKLTGGYEIRDKHDMVKLKKLAADTFKIKKGSYDLTTRALDRALQDLGKQAKVTEVQVTGEGLKATVKKEEGQKHEIPKPEAPKAPESKVEITKITTPALPLDYKDKYERMAEKGTEFLTTLYIKLGVIEGEVKEEPFNPKTWKEDVSKWGKDVAGYCYENNIKLPMWLELFALVATGALLLGMPIFNVLFFKKKSEAPEQDKELQEKVTVE